MCGQKNERKTYRGQYFKKRISGGGVLKEFKIIEEGVFLKKR